jgi:hypothetical protein
MTYRNLLLPALFALATTSCLEPVDDGATNRTPSWNGVLSTVVLDGERPVYTNVDESETAADPCTKVRDDAHAILRANCAMCHGVGAASLGNPPFSFIMDDEMLIASTWDREGDAAGTGPRFLTPGDPDHSLIYTRPIVIRNMPPIQADPGQPFYARVTYSDGSVLRAWISGCMGAAPATAGPGGAGGAGGTGSTN